MTQGKSRVPLGYPELVALGQLYRAEAGLYAYPNNRTYQKVSRIFGEGPVFPAVYSSSSYVDYVIPEGYCVPDHNPTRHHIHIPAGETLLTLRQFAALEWGTFSKCVADNEPLPVKEACRVYFEVLVMEKVGLLPASSIAYLCRHIG